MLFNANNMFKKKEKDNNLKTHKNESYIKFTPDLDQDKIIKVVNKEIKDSSNWIFGATTEAEAIAFVKVFEVLVADKNKLTQDIITISEEILTKELIIQGNIDKEHSLAKIIGNHGTAIAISNRIYDSAHQCISDKGNVNFIVDHFEDIMGIRDSNFSIGGVIDFELIKDVFNNNKQYLETFVPKRYNKLYNE